MDRSARVMAAVLAPILDAKRAEIDALRGRAAALRARAADAEPARGLAAALRRDGVVSVIAELKRRSPSAGWIRADADAASVARLYADAGAAALSVLTDGPSFGGSLDDLRAARAAVDLPVLRKDFVLDPLQLHEARAAGADAVLLIVRILDGGQLEDLLGEARAIGLDVLVETHDGDEVDRAVSAGAAAIGVNNRDLDTLQVDHTLAVRLAAHVPVECVTVAESGIAGAAQVDDIGAAGLDAILVGETLMRAQDPATALGQLVGRRKVGRG